MKARAFALCASLLFGISAVGCSSNEEPMYMIDGVNPYDKKPEGTQETFDQLRTQMEADFEDYPMSYKQVFFRYSTLGYADSDIQKVLDAINPDFNEMAKRRAQHYMESHKWDEITLRNYLSTDHYTQENIDYAVDHTYIPAKLRMDYSGERTIESDEAAWQEAEESLSAARNEN